MHERRAFEPSSLTPFQHLLAAAAEDRDAPLVSFIDGQTYTRGEIADAAAEMTAALQNAGVRRGERVGFLLGNRVEFLAVWLGVLGCGAVAVPINTAMRGRGLEHVLQTSEPMIVISEVEFAAAVESAVANLSADPPLLVWWGGSRGSGVGYDAFLGGASGGDPAYAEQRLSDFSHILFTSGTTGPSKGVMWSNQTAVAMAEGGIFVMDYTPDDVVFTCLPLFHSNALFTTFLGALIRRARVAVSQRFSASSFWRQVHDSSATTISLLGSMVPILRGRTASSADLDHSVRRALVIPLDDHDEEVLTLRFGFECTTLYGLTDAGTPIGRPPGHRRPNSCGQVTPGWECVLADSQDNPVPVGSVGELLVRPLRPFMGQLGYYKMPEETLAAWRNLWCHTGDLMTQDEDGWFYFVDRAKDAIRRFGENVSSYEVEQALLDHPDVVEVAAYPVPSDLAEDEVMVAVVAAPGATATASDLIEWCWSHLPYFAVPRYIRFVAALPKTTTLKVQKHQLRQVGIDGAFDGGPVGRKSRERWLQNVSPDGVSP